jgi:hypothetical protein
MFIVEGFETLKLKIIPEENGETYTEVNTG